MTPKLHFTTPFGVATRSLRRSGVQYDCMSCTYCRLCGLT